MPSLPNTLCRLSCLLATLCLLFICTDGRVRIFNQIGNECVHILKVQRLLVKPNLQPFKSYWLSKSTKEQCFTKCILDGKCWASFYSVEKQVCHFYNTSSSEALKVGEILTTRIPCSSIPAKEKCSKVRNGGRCRGYWVLHAGMAFASRRSPKLAPFLNIRGITKRECRESCLKYKECGIVSYRQTAGRKTCSLYALFTRNLTAVFPFDISKTPVGGIYRWECCGKKDVSLRKDDTCKRKYTKPCVGQWKDALIRSSVPLTSCFMTSSFKVCRKACLNSATCSAFSFDMSKFICYHFGKRGEIGSCGFYVGGTVRPSSWPMKGYQWQCCGQAKGDSMNECYKLKLPKANRLSVVSVNLMGTSATSKPQSARRVSKHYRLLNKWQPTNKKVVLTIGGTTKLWIGVVRNNKMHYLSLKEFKTYARPSSMFQCVVAFGKYKIGKVIPRKKWLAQGNFPQATLFPSIPRKVIVLNTGFPRITPVSESVCSFYVRLIQHSHRLSRQLNDIAYNFVICGDGNVYEGRGWRIRGPHKKETQRDSLSIAFLGAFERESPPYNMIAALEYLLKKGKERGYLHPEYVLLGRGDVKNNRTPPGKMLVERLSSISHYKNANYPGLCLFECRMQTKFQRHIYIFVFVPILLLLFLVSVSLFMTHYRRQYVNISKVVLITDHTTEEASESSRLLQSSKMVSS